MFAFEGFFLVEGINLNIRVVLENGFSNGNEVQILSGNSGNGGMGLSDEAVWATEEDYGMWNGEASNWINVEAFKWENKDL